MTITAKLYKYMFAPIIVNVLSHTSIFISAARERERESESSFGYYIGQLRAEQKEKGKRY